MGKACAIDIIGVAGYIGFGIVNGGLLQMMALHNQAFRKYAVFSGRSSRSEYWSFVLVWALIYISGVIVSRVDFPDVIGGIIWVAYMVYLFATLIPWLALTVRRLHDTGRSGWWFLIYFIPLGGIVLLVFMCLRSDPQPNKYGMPYSKTEAPNANYYRIKRQSD